MKNPALALVVLALFLGGCNSNTEGTGTNDAAPQSESGLPVSEERFKDWAAQADVSVEREETVRKLLIQAARGKASGAKITDPVKREKALKDWEAAVEAMIETVDGDGKELFIEAGLISAEGSDK